MSYEIMYTKTDEAPALATRSLLPVLRKVCSLADIQIRLKDISLAGRILAAFPESLPGGGSPEDALGFLGELAKTPRANIVKLPNISASQPQLEEAIRELQSKGYRIPDYPASPGNPQEQLIKATFDRIKGSAVNPVLREGNSDRRAPAAVKAYARAHPHSMGAWSPESRTRVASMSFGDFYQNEQAWRALAPCTVRYELRHPDGRTDILKSGLALEAGEILDSSALDRRALETWLTRTYAQAREEGLMVSIHLKATMMKVSDPLIFATALQTFLPDFFARHAGLLGRLGFKAADGLASLEQAMAGSLDPGIGPLKADLATSLKTAGAIAMVDSAKGITNFHVPSDIIIDASMPAVIRAGGKMWGADGQLHDTLALIPDRSYAGVYQAAIDFCKTHGALDPATMGSVSNVGLMARKAEEYGSHDKTFEIRAEGRVQVVDEATGEVLLTQPVQAGDIYRGCQLKDDVVVNWVQLAVQRARISGQTLVFWLDDTRAHDRLVIQRVTQILPQLDCQGLEILMLDPAEACTFSLARSRQGLDTISATGNVLRDYLTDLFPILELGTSAKMLSIVPLMQGGMLFETGAGGSAPKHVQQFLEEGHLRWDSLGEYLAFAEALEHLGRTMGNSKATILAKTLDQANGQYLDQDRSPSRKTGELDTRGCHYYLALYWLKALAAQEEDPDLAAACRPLALALEASGQEILAELLAAQGQPVDIGGYYLPEETRTESAMRPSPTLNRILEGLGA